MAASLVRAVGERERVERVVQQRYSTKRERERERWGGWACPAKTNETFITAVQVMLKPMKANEVWQVIKRLEPAGRSEVGVAAPPASGLHLSR